MLIAYWLPDHDRTLLCEDADTGEWWTVPLRRGGWYERDRYALADVWLPERWEALAADVANVALALVGAPHGPVTLEQCQAYLDEIGRCHAEMGRLDRRMAERRQVRAAGPSDADRAAVAAIQARIAELARGVA